MGKNKKIERECIGVRPMMVSVMEYAIMITKIAMEGTSLLEMAETKSSMRKPMFTKVDQLRPGTSGHNLIVKVVSSNMVLQKDHLDGPQVRQMRTAECLVRDETGTIVFTARNDQGNVPSGDLIIVLGGLV
ncbi:uncharacterized protein At4g28440-like [Camellia sinensis]|uniref:uncharacterized protein At4g28440-like n=1 Tax=Camellia sinensis TaxID=4442 RepID=UPI0010366072|nr:uncharacterized protein At4g28440-like [Camellia sinensis]